MKNNFVQSNSIALLVDKINIVESDIAKSNVLHLLKQSDKPEVVSFINAHAINTCYRNQKFFTKLEQSDYLFRDGIGMEILCKKAALPSGLNMNGTDFIPEILRVMKDNSIALYGTSSENVETTAHILKNKGYNIVSAIHGFKPDDVYVKDAQKIKPRVILLGMGMPIQEQVAIDLKNSLDFPCVIINGGALIDFISGRIRRAPKIVRQLKSEWIYRLIQEPKRLYKRYLIGNLLFIYRTRPLVKQIKIITRSKSQHNYESPRRMQS